MLDLIKLCDDLADESPENTIKTYIELKQELLAILQATENNEG